MRTHPLPIAVFLASSMLAGVAHAENEPAEPEPTEEAAAAPTPSANAERPPPAKPTEARERNHDVSITFSPIHLLLPVVEVTGEYALDDKFGLALIGGFGSIPITTTTIGPFGSSSSTEHVGVWELGGHANYYVVGTFDHGMQLGAEVLWVGASAGGNSTHGAVLATGLAVGPYVGYKIVTRIGFTFEGNLGVEYMAAHASSSTSTADQKTVIPLLNLNVGWSF
jgi:hypothetical protein